MKTSTALLVPSKIKPKPTKAEIISALAQLQIQKLEKERKEAIATRNELAAIIDARLVEIVRAGIGKPIPEVRYGYANYDIKDGKPVYRGTVHSVEVHFDINELPKEATRLLLEYHRLSEIADRRFDENQVRKQIAMKASGFSSREERVSAMLEDEDSRKALDAMLESIS